VSATVALDKRHWLYILRKTPDSINIDWIGHRYYLKQNQFPIDLSETCTSIGGGGDRVGQTITSIGM
jgi:hypothetical protein